MQHAVPANTTGLPEDRLQVAIDVFYELDDIIGRLDSAIKVMDMLTENTPVSLSPVGLVALTKVDRAAAERVEGNDENGKWRGCWK